MQGDSDEGTPAEARRMADQLVALVQRKGVQLDYSPGSLEAIDLVVENIKATGLSERDASGMIYAVGCYVGEVLVQHAGGKWCPTPELSMEHVCSWPLVVQMPGGAGVNPIGKAFKRFRNGDVDSLRFFYHATLKTLERS
jgi:hypothetical protein